MTPQEAIAYGLVDGVVGSRNGAAGS